MAPDAHPGDVPRGSARDVGDELSTVVSTLHADLLRFAQSRLAGAVASSSTLAAGVGDLDAAAGDVVGEVLCELWESRHRWAQVRELRAWAFGMTRVQVARHVRAARVRARLEVRLPEGAIESLPGPASTPSDADDQRQAQLEAVAQVRAIVVARVGVEGWDRVSRAVCGPRAPRRTTTRAALAAAVERARRGEAVDVAPLVRAAGLDAAVWAASQVTAGRSLNPARAVADGAAGTVSHARRALATWWIHEGAPAGHVPQLGDVLAAGLVEDLPPAERERAAASLLGWLSWRHPDLMTAASGEPTMTGLGDQRVLPRPRRDG